MPIKTIYTTIFILLVVITAQPIERTHSNLPFTPPSSSDFSNKNDNDSTDATKKYRSNTYVIPVQNTLLYEYKSKRILKPDEEKPDKKTKAPDEQTKTSNENKATTTFKS